jgi:hypothetical protein
MEGWVMRKLVCAAVFCSALTVTGLTQVMGANALATQVQAAVSSALQELKFDAGKGGMPGAPAKLKITKATLDNLKKLMDDGKQISIDADGKITIEKATADK